MMICPPLIVVITLSLSFRSRSRSGERYRWGSFFISHNICKEIFCFCIFLIFLSGFREGGSSSSHRSRRHREDGERERERERKHRHKDRHRSRSHSHRSKRKRYQINSTLLPFSTKPWFTPIYQSRPLTYVW